MQMGFQCIQKNPQDTQQNLKGNQMYPTNMQVNSPNVQTSSQYIPMGTQFVQRNPQDIKTNLKGSRMYPNNTQVNSPNVQKISNYMPMGSEYDQKNPQDSQKVSQNMQMSSTTRKASRKVTNKKR